MLKYKCLVLDHDDTVAMSTPQVHFPVFLDTLSKLRPQVHMTLEEFMLYCFEPGFQALCTDVLKFDEEEMAVQVKNWRAYVELHIPKFFDGVPEIIHRQKELGGYVCVVSHSCSDNIRRDYRENCGIEPDLVFGWELGEEYRKPKPYPLEEIMRTYQLSPKDLLMVDDLKPGYDMAKECGVSFACAGWSNQIPRIATFMKQNCDYYLEEVSKLESLLSNL